MKFKRLRTRLSFWFLAVTILSLTTVVTLFCVRQAGVIREQEFDKLQVVRDLKVMKLSDWIDQRLGDLKVAAGDNEIRALENVMMRRDAESAPAALSPARHLLQRYLDHYDVYYELFIVSASSGRVVVSTDVSSEGEDKKTDPYFTEPMRSRQSYIKDIYYSETENGPAMAFSTPIFSQTQDGENISGILVARINLKDDFYPLFQERTGLGDTGETLIVNRNGLALNNLRWKKDAALKLTISAAPAVKASNGETGVIQIEDYRNVPVLAAYTHIPQTGWGFVAKRDLAEVYAPIRAMLKNAVMTATAVILIVIAVSLLIARSIANPVRDLTRATTRMAAGDAGIRVRIETGDEIEELATAFNRMAAHLDAAREKAAQTDWLKTGLSELDDILRGTKKMDVLCNDIITYMARTLDVQVGTLSLADAEGSRLALVGSYAYEQTPDTKTEFKFGEGLIGQAAQGRKRIVLKNASEEGLTIRSTLGEIVPETVVCLPLLYGDEVSGVIELGSLHPFTELQLALLDQSAERIAIAINSAHSRERLQTLLEESQTQSEELQTQQEELRVTNEELEEKANELETRQKENEDERDR